MSEYLYILFDEPKKNLIIGTTSNLLMHMHEIKNKTNDIYKNEYETNKLAYYEKFDELSQVIIRWIKKSFKRKHNNFNKRRQSTMEWFAWYYFKNMEYISKTSRQKTNYTKRR